MTDIRIGLRNFFPFKYFIKFYGNTETSNLCGTYNWGNVIHLDIYDSEHNKETPWFLQKGIKLLIFRHNKLNTNLKNLDPGIAEYVEAELRKK